MAKKNRPLGGLFLSTPSARRATLPRAIIERRIAISIHALREEGDTYHPHMHLLLCVFLSTPSARRATYSRFRIFLHSGISIHALREEGDAPVMYRLSRPKYFYPRPPRGGRLLSIQFPA